MSLTADTSRDRDRRSRARGETPARPADELAADGDRLPYLPGLDGLRAVALVAVLAFHHRFPWARGGFLGVSSFFTLSGFLIASLALSEWATSGRLSWAQFWERRARRLLPAALMALAGIAVLQATLRIGSGPTFRGDVLASLGYVANWRFMASTGDYALMFADPSPLTHMWSLAIEEQFYLVFPVVFAGLMVAARRTRRPRGVAAGGFAALALASFALAAVSVGDGDNSGATYYSTVTRAGELLAGVTLAYGWVWLRRHHLAGPTAHRWARRVLDAAGALALAALALLWHTVSLGSPLLFRGGTAANAALTATVILALATGGPTAGALAVLPLRALGKISYGAYLYHWPIFLVLDAERTRVEHPVRLFVVRVTATLAVATASYVLVESRVRFGTRTARRRLALSLGAGAVAVVLLVALLPVHAPAGARLDDGGSLSWTVDATVGDPTRVLLVGDSVAWSLGSAFKAWNGSTTDQVAVEAHTPFGCPLGAFDTPLRINGRPWRFGEDCAYWHDHLDEIVARSDAEVIVFSSGVFELGEREFAGDWYHLGDPVYDRWLRQVVTGVADLLASRGVPVVWLTHPHVRMADPRDPTVPWHDMDENDPARVDRLNEIVDEVAAGRDGFHRVDLGTWTRQLPDEGFDPEVRDGVHYAWAAADLVGAWLAPRVIEAAGTAPPGGASATVEEPRSDGIGRSGS